MSSLPPGDAGLPEDAPLVAVRRGALVESVHRGRIAVCDPRGSVLDAVGDPDAYVYARSSAKPFQALPLVLSGAADAFGLTDEELAVACASHNAEEPHLSAVRSILEKAGLAEEDLQNGAHPPLYAPEAAKLARSGEEPRAIHGNCSGKHAGMLAVCAHEGYATGGYRDPGHPLQRRILALLCEVCGLDEDEVLISGRQLRRARLRPSAEEPRDGLRPASRPAKASRTSSPMPRCASGTRCEPTPSWSLGQDGSTPS